VNKPSLVQPVDLRRVMSTGVGIILVAAGVILRFAVRTTFIHGLNMHVVGVIVMLAGVFGLLLSLLVWGPLNRRRNHSGGYVPRAPPLARQRSVSRTGRQCEASRHRDRESASGESERTGGCPCGPRCPSVTTSSPSASTPKPRTAPPSAANGTAGTRACDWTPSTARTDHWSTRSAARLR